MSITRAQQLKQLVPGLNALFGQNYKAYPDEHTHFYATSTSKRAWEEDVKLAGFGLGEELEEGRAISYDDGAKEVFTARYVHAKVGMGFRITEEAMEDNLYESIAARYTKAMARSMQQTKQLRAMDLINRGFTTFNGPDGVTLFSTAHPTVSGLTNANRPVTPVDFNETSLEAAIIQIGDWVDERGLKIMAQVKHLVVPMALQFNAQRVLMSDLRVATSDNDPNAIRDMRAVPGGFKVNHYLTDTNAWYLLTDVPDGLRHFVRRPYKTSMDGDFDTGNVRYKATERYSFGVSDPLGIWGSPGST